MKRLKVSLSSSYELKADREQFEIFVNRRNKSWADQGIFIELVIWEDFLDHMSVDGLQAEYNKVMRESDIFVMLYHTKVGPYTASEFETAFGTFQENGRPIIYTYFKDVAYDATSIPERDSLSLKAFQAKLAELQHFPTVYKNIEGLLLHFGGQLDKLRDGGKIGGAATVAGERVKVVGAMGASAVTHSSRNLDADSKTYKMDRIHKLLDTSMNDTALQTFCMLHFALVHNNLTEGQTKLQRVNMLLDHANRRLKLETLLALMESTYPENYQQYAPYF